MQSDFQTLARRKLDDFARSNGLEGYPLNSENGTQYKFINATFFTVYHDRLDADNRGRIEIALGVDNLAAEHSISTDVAARWLATMQATLHPAREKEPEEWPRLAVWSLEDVERFCLQYDQLTTQGVATTAGTDEGAQKTPPPPPIDERVMREILTRRGQSDFRTALLSAYGARCAVSDCRDIDVLEAAHIRSHSESQDYRVSNGLLLRADVHTLFDLRLISVSPGTGKVVVSSRLGPVYHGFHGRDLNLPADSELWPDPTALRQHFSWWQAKEQGVD